MNDTTNKLAFDALNIVISALSRLDSETRRRVLQSVATFYEFSPEAGLSHIHPLTAEPKKEGLSGLGFSVDHSISPKTFLVEKQPRTDVERVACLAYYLTHYKGTQYFKTLDIGKLNTEAAQPKFSNTAYATNNASKMGYLAPAPKGQRQLSAAGEMFVSALPDRDAARQAMEKAKPRKNGSRKK